MGLASSGTAPSFGRRLVGNTRATRAGGATAVGTLQGRRWLDVNPGGLGFSAEDLACAIYRNMLSACRDFGWTMPAGTGLPGH